MLKKSLFLFLIIALLVPFAALSEEIVSFTDSTGRIVQVPKDIKRIASTGPLAQIALLPIASEMLVGLSNNLDDLERPYLEPLVGNLPLVGQLYGGSGDINLEELARLDPQVIIDVGEPKKTIKEDMGALQEQLGIPCVHITMYYKDAGHAYQELGKLLGKEDRAAELSGYLDQSYARMAEINEKVGENQANMLYCVGEAGLNVIAQGSFHAEIIDLVASNAAVVETPSSRGTGNEVGMEQLLLWDPDFIVFETSTAYENAENDPLWSSMQAIQNKKYMKVPKGPYNWLGFPPSVQRYLGSMWLQKTLYPELVGYDLKEEVQEYFSLFYSHDLSDAQYDEIMLFSLPK